MPLSPGIRSVPVTGTVLTRYPFCTGHRCRFHPVPVLYRSQVPFSPSIRSVAVRGTVFTRYPFCTGHRYRSYPVSVLCRAEVPDPLHGDGRGGAVQLPGRPAGERHRLHCGAAQSRHRVQLLSAGLQRPRPERLHQGRGQGEDFRYAAAAAEVAGTPGKSCVRAARTCDLFQRRLFDLLQLLALINSCFPVC